MTSRADATLAAIVRELAKDGWPELSMFRVRAAADFCAITPGVLTRRMWRAGYAVATTQRGWWCLTPAGMAAVEDSRRIVAETQGEG